MDGIFKIGNAFPRKIRFDRFKLVGNTIRKKV